MPKNIGKIQEEKVNVQETVQSNTLFIDVYQLKLKLYVLNPYSLLMWHYLVSEIKVLSLSHQKYDSDSGSQTYEKLKPLE